MVSRRLRPSDQDRRRKLGTVPQLHKQCVGDLAAGQYGCLAHGLDAFEVGIKALSWCYQHRLGPLTNTF
jgi:hypothetical protein